MDKIKNLRSAVKIYRAFDIRIEINSFIAKVFDALTTAKGLNSWWTDNSKVDPREGGRIEYIWHFGEKSLTAKAIYRNFELPHSFKVEYLEWIDEVEFFGKVKENPFHPPTSQCYELHAESNNKTKLFILTSGMKYGKEFDHLFEGTYKGWINSLANLKSVCETGIDLRQELNA